MCVSAGKSVAWGAAISVIVGLAGLTPAHAQTPYQDAAAYSPSGSAAPVWRDEVGDKIVQVEAEMTARLNRQSAFNVAADRAYGPALEFPSDFAPPDAAEPGFAAATRDVWFEGDAYSDRLRLRTLGQLTRADGAPLPPAALDAAGFEVRDYDISYVRGWPAARGYTASGLEVTLTPHVGVGAGSRGGSAEAGATLRIGQDVSRMVPEGGDAFGERARWYVYAAGSGRAVGYNFARTRDGDYARSGYSHDSGAFLGDASIGVAYRRGDVQSSIGFVYREIDPRGIRGYGGIETEVSEGMLAFHLSIKPDW